MANIVRFTVSRQLILQALHIPESASIRQIRDDVNVFSGDLEFYIEHESLGEVSDGDVIPKRIPTITEHTHVCNCEPVERTFYTYEWDWGV